MKQADIAARLDTIEALLRAHAGSADPAIENSLDTYAQVAQLREVYATQRDTVTALVVIANLLLVEGRVHDAKSAEEREQLAALLLQLREIGRKHVAGLYDLERAIYGGLTPDERVRSEGE